LTLGSNVLEKDNEGRTALMYVVATGKPNTDIINLLINAGSNVIEKDNFGMTALTHAYCNCLAADDVTQLLTVS
jgi:ankyrin repeat protein